MLNLTGFKLIDSLDLLNNKELSFGFNFNGLFKDGSVNNAF